MTSKEKTKSLVNKATTDDRNPPSGYLLKELSSRTMSIQECQTIEDLVIKKLAKNKPYIKYKALRIVKFLCENGSPNWRRAWQRNTDKLRDAQQFRGPPDPIYGDAPYQQVRKAAKDAMQAVFQQSQINSANIRDRIKGVNGGSAYGGYSNSSSSSFGSGSKGVYGGASLSKSKKAPTAPSWDKKVDTSGHGNTSYQPTVRTTTFEPLKSSGGYSNPAVLAGTNVHSRGKLDTRKAAKGKRRKGKAGGVWGGDDDDDDGVESEEEDYQTYDDFPTSTSYEKPRKKAFGGNIKKKSKSSGQYEKRWVDDIVKSGGVGCKILDLPKYVQQFENLSKNHVLEYLDEKLEDSAWQKQGKALALIEALIKGKSSDDVIDYFNQSPENIQACQNAKKSILRRKANAIVEYLDFEDDEEEEDEDDEEEEEQPVAQQPSTNDDLLGMGGGTGGGDEDEDDMFANMNTEEKPTQQQPQEDLLGNSMFDNMNQPQQQTQPATTGTNDIMNLMGDVVSTQENLQQAQEQQRKKEKYAFLDNLAADSGVNQQNNTGDILGFGSNTNTNAQTQSQPQSGGGGGSAFGFDLGGSNNTQGNNIQSAQTQSQQQSGGGGSSAFGFELGGSGNGGNTNQAQTQQQQAPKQSGAVSGASGGSAFGFDLSGSGSSTQPQTNQTSQSMNSMNTMNTMNPMGMMTNQQTINNPMMTQNMLQQNMQNMAQMNQMMNQMQQMQMNPNMMNMMQQSIMQQGMMQQNMMQSGGGIGNNQQGGNSFLQAMQNVNNPTQPQKPQQVYVNHSDPFAQMMATASNTSQGTNAPQRTAPKKTGPDPFAEFGLKSMQ